MTAPRALLLGLLLLMGASPLYGQVVITSPWGIAPPAWGPRSMQMAPWGVFAPPPLYGRSYYAPPQPMGHQITPTGPNGYTYEPVYAPAQSNAAPASLAAPAPAVAAQSGYERALALFRAGRYDAVLLETGAIVLVNPDDGRAQLLESHALFALGRFDESAAALRRFLLVTPEAQWPALLAGPRDEYRATRYSTHLAALERHLQVRPTDVDVKLLLAYHAGNVGLVQQAVMQLTVLVPTTDDDAARRLLEYWRAPPR